MKQTIKVIFSPLLIIFIGFLVSFIFNKFIGSWVFIPLAIVYWGLVFYTVKLNKDKIKESFQASKKSEKYGFLAYLPCLFCIVAFVWGLQYITLSPILIILSVLFIAINPVAEELFWRQYLLDNLPWKNWQKILYSTFLFMLSHPLMWGIFSVTIRSTIMIMPLFIMGIVWSIVYLKTKTLRHCIIAHTLVDTLNLSIWVFLNIYVPPVVWFIIFWWKI